MVVLVEHVGFGGRDRQLWLYWWDARDGAEWSGWWVTPDFIGNNDFFVHCASDAPTPAAAAVGSWRSPNVEQQQLKRKLELGFEGIPDTDGDLVACGADAATPFIPDGVCRIQLSKMEWRQDGLNHGKPAYQAYERRVPADVPSDARQPDGSPASDQLHPAALIAIGIAIGIVATAVMRRM